LFVASQQPQRAPVAKQFAQTIFRCFTSRSVYIGNAGSAKTTARSEQQPPAGFGKVIARHVYLNGVCNAAAYMPPLDAAYIRSNTAAIPCPPPIHIVVNA
jgi:hypothetical protein